MKIQGLCQKMTTQPYKGKKVMRGPYWYGWWTENGKQKMVYIGKELPVHLEWLLNGRVKKKGQNRWTWPALRKVKVKG